MTIYHCAKSWKNWLATAAGCLLLALAPLSVPAQSSPTATPKTSDKDAVEKERQRLENLVRDERRRLEEEIRQKRQAELKVRTERLEANRPRHGPGAAEQTTRTAIAGGAPSGPVPPEHGPAIAPPAGQPPGAAPPAPPPPAPVESTASAARFAPPLVLMIKPYNQAVRAGQRFTTKIALHAEKSETYDRLNLNITYPQGVVRPLQVFDYPIHPDTAASVPNIVSLGGKAVLTYSAEFPAPQKLRGEADLLYVLWEAVEPAARVSLSLGGDGPESGVLLGKENLLNASILASNATISALVHITPALGTKERVFSAGSRPMPASVRPAQPDTVASGIALRLRKPVEESKMGDEFVIDVVLKNPSRVAFDDLQLVIGFDPTRARIVDSDYHNWIKNGTNIFDGLAHRSFPFNVLLRNESDNRTGRIYYHMASTFPRSMGPGTIAQIRVRALRSGAADSFTLNPADTIHTDVSAGGVSLLRQDGEYTSVAAASSDR